MRDAGGRWKLGWPLLLALFAGLASPGAAPERGTGAGAIPGPPARVSSVAPGESAPGEVIVKFRRGARDRARAALRTRFEARAKRRYRMGAEHWKVRDGLTTGEVLGRLRGHPNVEYAEPNYVLEATRLPDDPRFPEQYGLKNTGQVGGVRGADLAPGRGWRTDAPACASTGRGSPPCRAFRCRRARPIRSR